MFLSLADNQLMYSLANKQILQAGARERQPTNFQTVHTTAAKLCLVTDN